MRVRLFREREWDYDRVRADEDLDEKMVVGDQKPACRDRRLGRHRPCGCGACGLTPGERRGMVL
jgi:hypothetical protein